MYKLFVEILSMKNKMLVTLIEIQFYVTYEWLSKF